MALHWKIPFVSLNETAYVINIYDANYTGSPVTLMGGTQPFVTSEDDNTDIFTPLRAQTGYINVIDEDGTLMELMMPTSATSHYMEVKSGNTVCWQGFLTDEAYSQTWDNQPKEINVAVRSVLGIMDSLMLDESISANFSTLKSAISDILSTVKVFMPHDVYDSVVYPSDASGDEEGMFVYMANFFDHIEQVNESERNITVVSHSAGDILRAICSFLGWECREYERVLYFTNIDTRRTVCRSYAKNGSVKEELAKQTKVLTTLTFAAMDHKQGFVNSARTVKVVANINSMSVNSFTSLNIPPVTRVPTPSPHRVTMPQMQYVSGGVPYYAQSLIPSAYYFAQMGQKNSRISLKCFCMNISYTSIGRYVTINSKREEDQTQRTDPFYDIVLCNNASGVDNQRYFSLFMDFANSGQFEDKTFYTGAYMLAADFYLSNQPHVADSPVDGVMALVFPQGFDVPAYPINFHENDYIIKMSSERFTSGNGYFNIQFSACYFTAVGTWGYGGMQENGFLMFGLKMGNKWWNGTEWKTEFSTFKIEVNKNNGEIQTNRTLQMDVSGKDGWFVPISPGEEGELSLYFYPYAERMYMYTVYNNYPGGGGSGVAYQNASVYEIFFKRMSLDFISRSDVTEDSIGENTYFRILTLAASQEKQIDLELATDNNNLEGFGIVHTDINTKPTTWPYYTGTGTATKDQRPELHLLDRMATYYSKVRRWFKVKVRHPEDVLQLTRYTHNGITYAPVAESRNWRDDESEITLTEIPT